MFKNKIFTLLWILSVVLVLPGCVGNSYQAAMNAADVALAASSFGEIKDIIEAKQDSFTADEWSAIESARTDFDAVVETITMSGNIVTVDQLKVMRTALKGIYLTIYDVIHARINEFPVKDRLQLINFHNQMERIDIMLDELEQDPNAAQMESTINAITMALSIAAKVIPVLL